MLMCLELVVMDLRVMWIPLKLVFSVKSKVSGALNNHGDAVLVIIAVIRLLIACPADHLVKPVMILLWMLNAVVMLFVLLLLEEGIIVLNF